MKAKRLEFVSFYDLVVQTKQLVQKYPMLEVVDDSVGSSGGIKTYFLTYSDDALGVVSTICYSTKEAVCLVIKLHKEKLKIHLHSLTTQGGKSAYIWFSYKEDARVDSSPSAEKYAKEKGVDIKDVFYFNGCKKVNKRDVDRYLISD